MLVVIWKDLSNTLSNKNSSGRNSGLLYVFKKGENKNL